MPKLIDDPKNKYEALKLYERYSIVRDKLLEYENNYDEELDKYNKIMYEYEYKELYKKLNRKTRLKIIQNNGGYL